MPSYKLRRRRRHPLQRNMRAIAEEYSVRVRPPPLRSLEVITRFIWCCEFRGFIISILVFGCLHRSGARTSDGHEQGAMVIRAHPLPRYPDDHDMVYSSEL